MKTAEYVILLMTTATADEARQIAETLLKCRKAACINIVTNVSSCFWWQDELDSAQEQLLIVKTKARFLSEIINLVKGLHSYDVPEVIALPIIGGNPDYLQWLRDNVL